EPWSLEIAGELHSPGEGGVVHSGLTFALREPGGATGDAPVAQGSLGAAINLGDQPGTEESGREFALDLALLPSWEDPAGEAFVARVDLSVRSDGQSAVLASAVEPNPLIHGYQGPINF